MQKRLYFFFYNKFNNASLARLLSNAFYKINIIVYKIRKKIIKKDIVTINVEDASSKINKVSPCPKITYTLNNSGIHDNTDLSIIVPVYNYESVLENCIQSIINQNTRYKYEIIFVDDGSTDKSSEILQKYINVKKVKVLTQKNLGISKARNTGIDNAKGSYLMFVDCDDYLEPSIVESLLNIAYSNDVDIVESGYYTFNNKGRIKDFIMKSKYVKNNCSDVLLNHAGLPWGKIYKRELFDEIRFPESSWYEDTLIKFIIFRLCKSYFYYPEALYGYRMYEGNFTKVQNKSIRCIEHYWILSWLVELSHKLEIEDEVSLYKTLLLHLGSIFAARTVNLDVNLRKTVFILACELAKNSKPKKRYTIPYMYKQLEMSLEEKDYSLWLLTCKHI